MTRHGAARPGRARATALVLVGVLLAPAAGEFDQIRLGAGSRSPLPAAVRVLPGQWTTVTLEVGIKGGWGGGPPRLEIKRARALGPS